MTKVKRGESETETLLFVLDSIVNQDAGPPSRSAFALIETSNKRQQACNGNQGTQSSFEGRLGLP